MNATFLTKRILRTVTVRLRLQGSEPGPAPPVTMERMDKIVVATGLALSEWGETRNPPAIMLTPLHQVCTGISGKVQTKMPAGTVRIVLLGGDRER